MKIAVIGATGLVGERAATVLRDRGHDVVAVSRATGVDVITGRGLDEALAGVESVVDATNLPTKDSAEAIEFFGTATKNIVAAGQRAGVGHYVLLSIINVEKPDHYGYFDGKVAQEQYLKESGMPHTIVRAAQFHEFAETVVSWSTVNGVANVAPLLMQPVASVEVADYLAGVAAQAPLNGTVNVAGPKREDLFDMARRALQVRGSDVKLTPTWSKSIFDQEMAGEMLLPDEDAVLGTISFEDWLANS
jgi:uncharacterized protein YbjT (DUF2867 family)